MGNVPFLNGFNDRTVVKSVQRKQIFHPYKKQSSYLAFVFSPSFSLSISPSLSPSLSPSPSLSLSLSPSLSPSPYFSLSISLSLRNAIYICHSLFLYLLGRPLSLSLFSLLSIFLPSLSISHNDTLCRTIAGVTNQVVLGRSIYGFILPLLPSVLSKRIPPRILCS